MRVPEADVMADPLHTESEEDQTSLFVIVLPKSLQIKKLLLHEGCIHFSANSMQKEQRLGI